MELKPKSKTNLKKESPNTGLFIFFKYIGDVRKNYTLYYGKEVEIMKLNISKKLVVQGISLALTIGGAVCSNWLTNETLKDLVKKQTQNK